MLKCIRRAYSINSFARKGTKTDHCAQSASQSLFQDELAHFPHLLAFRIAQRLKHGS